MLFKGLKKFKDLRFGVMYNLGLLYMVTNHLEKAEEVYEDLIKYLEKIVLEKSDKDLFLENTLINYCITLLKLGKVTKLSKNASMHNFLKSIKH